MNGDKQFTSQTVLITGASRGIGAAIAERFASVGMNIILHYLNSHESANEVARRCLQLGSNVMTVTADLRSKEQILRMKEKLEAHQMLPDIVVNNAGVSHYSLLSDVSEEDWDYIMNVNLKGTFLCSQIFMEKNGEA